MKFIRVRVLINVGPYDGV